jgi:hypothetical protein
MFLLLSQSNPYFEERNNNQNNQMAHKDLEGIEIDLKDRFKEQDKIIKFHHFDDMSLETKEELISSAEEDESGDDSSQNNSSSLISLNSENKINKKLKEKKSLTLKKEDQLKMYRQTRMDRFKLLIKIFDLVAILIMIITHVLSQIEDEEYYLSNREVRIAGSILFNYLYRSDNNSATWNEVFDDSRLNLKKIFFLCLEKENETLHRKYPKKISDYMYSKGITNFHEMNNFQILEAYSISKTTYGYDLDSREMSDGGSNQNNNLNDSTLSYENFNIDLKVSELSNRLRIAILVLTIAAFCLFFISWYLQYYLEEKLDLMIGELNKESKQDNEETKDNNMGPNNNGGYKKIPHFYNSIYFLYLILELIILAVIPYPGENFKFIVKYSKRAIIYPFSSLFNAILTLRILFILKLINIYSLYRKPTQEKILLKNGIKPNFIFDLKAYHKKYPFYSLVIIFVLIVYIFGNLLRYFEMYYWEGATQYRQFWNYRWNSFWCVFISMTTVAFGDLYPSTHIGRILIIIATIIGIYFIFMSMTLITQKSILSDTELKAYKLINRLRFRTLLKDVNANIIYHSLKMIQLRKKFKKKDINNQKIYEMEFDLEKKAILNEIENYKIFNEQLKASDKVQTKDQLIDILEQIEKNIYDIEEELIILEKINTSFQGFKNTQLLMIKYLKSNILNTQFIYDILQRNHKIYGVLGMDQNVAEKEKHKLQQEIDILYNNYHEAEKALIKNSENNKDINNNENNDNVNDFFGVKRNSVKMKKKNTIYILNERNDSHANKNDMFNWEKFFLPLSAQNLVGKKKKIKRLSNASVSKIKRGNGSGVWSTNSTIIGDGRRIYPEDLYARELQKYNVDQNDFSKYFYSVFFQRNNNHNMNHLNDEKNLIQNVIMRNYPKTLSSIKVMKNIKSKLDKIIQKYKESSGDSSSNSMDENKEVENAE